MVEPGTLGALGLDRVIHERARLVILTHLASSSEAETGFTELRDGLGFTAGNLSAQLRTLEEAGLIAIEKRFRDNKPFTGVRLTVKGEQALAAYLAELEVIVGRLRAPRE
jgi:DNA-binding HxlR family transcriptional regulator